MSPHDPANPVQTILLPNGSKLPTTGISAESSVENLSLPNGICYQVRPTNQPPSCYQFLVLTGSLDAMRLLQEEEALGFTYW
jgi:hypothetical protein